MAASKLKPCDTCGHSISTDTKTCPSCGAKNKKKVGKIGLSIAALFLIFAIIGINDQQEAEQAAAAEAKKQQPCLPRKTMMSCTNPPPQTSAWKASSRSYASPNP